MAIANTITPANVHFSIGGTAVSINDAKLDISIANNSRYVECLLEDGKKGYLLTKGVSITRQGDLKVQTIRTGDGKSEEAIETIIDKQRLAYTSDNPEDYNQDIAFSVNTSGGKTFLNVTFLGFIKEYREFDPVGTEPPRQEAEIELYDPTTLSIT